MLRELRDWFEELACRAGFEGLPSRSGMLAIVAVCAAIGVAGWMWAAPSGAKGASAEMPAAPIGASADAKTPDSAAAAAVTATPAVAATVTVHVVGEVRHPGVYVLPGGARASDAVQAAGGLLGDAEEAAVNLARVVADGEQIAVPRQGEGPVASAAPAAGGAPVAAPGAAGGKVDLNTATAEQLDALPGIGPSTAAKIIADRTASGPFRTVDDLMRVPGIGPSKFEALKDLVTAG